MAMFYTYVLLSEMDNQLHIGRTNELRKRIDAHRAGEVQSTADRRPWSLIYYEACRNREDATRRERFLKSGKGKRFLRKRLESFFEQPRSPDAPERL